MSTPRRIAVIGAGLMGSALSRAFAAAGHDVTVWNRTPEKAEAVGGGVVAVDSLPEAVSGRDLVVISVSNYDATTEILAQDGVAAALAGSTIVQITSGSASDARRGLAWAAEHGIEYLDAAILAYPSFVATPYAIVFYSGDRTLFDRHSPTLTAIAENAVFVSEEIGAAATLDSAILEAYYGGSLAFLHGAALVQAEGISPDVFFDYKDTFLGLISVTADAARDMIGKGDFSGDQCSLDTHVGAIEHIVSLSRESGVSTALPEHLLVSYRSAVEAGRGGEELAAVYTTFASD